MLFYNNAIMFVNGKTWNCTDEGLVVGLNATGEDVINEQGMDNIAVGGGEISGIICRAQWEQLECDWCERVDKPRLLGIQYSRLHATLSLVCHHALAQSVNLFSGVRFSTIRRLYRVSDNLSQNFERLGYVQRALLHFGGLL